MKLTSKLENSCWLVQSTGYIKHGYAVIVCMSLKLSKNPSGLNSI